MTHAPCDLGQQERRQAVRREAIALGLARRRRRGRREDQAVSADAAESAFRGAPDVWASLRF
jgi:hypothetical protein